MKQGVSPAVVGLLRGFVWSVASLAIQTALALTNVVHVPAGYAWLVPAGVLLLRNGEGAIDKKRGQAPQIPGGSKPADPGAYQPTYMPPPAA